MTTRRASASQVAMAECQPAKRRVAENAPYLSDLTPPLNPGL